jgi:hypothetical protein
MRRFGRAIFIAFQVSFTAIMAASPGLPVKARWLQRVLVQIGATLSARVGIKAVRAEKIALKAQVSFDSNQTDEPCASSSII